MKNLVENYDIVVVGAGHAGCEAALAGARLGLSTIMFTVSVDSIALMPCNPNVGGSSKGHLVRELDALGGEMGKNIDKTFIQSKMLNCSKGPAVHSLRAQADKQAYSTETVSYTHLGMVAVSQTFTNGFQWCGYDFSAEIHGNLSRHNDLRVSFISGEVIYRDVKVFCYHRYDVIWCDHFLFVR